MMVLPCCRQVLWNQQTKEVFRENDTFRQPALAITLICVAREGYKCLTHGELGKKLLLDLQKMGT